MPRLENKIALVTGAARGIGEAIARAYALEGAKVIVSDIDDESGQIVATAIGAHYMHLDVREESDWHSVCEQIIAQWGRLNVVVNNAGITGFENGVVPHDPENVSLNAWQDVMRTNLEGVMLGCKYAIRAMRQTNSTGSIVNMSSRSGLVGIPGAAAYAASKAAIRNHSKTVALYCAGQNLPIRCNTIFPAAILTPMWEPMLGNGPEREQRMAAFVHDCPMQRFGRVDEVAALAVMLASDEVGYMNGAELVIDGGLLAGAAGTPNTASQ